MRKLRLESLESRNCLSSMFYEGPPLIDPDAPIVLPPQPPQQQPPFAPGDMAPLAPIAANWSRLIVTPPVFPPPEAVMQTWIMFNKDGSPTGVDLEIGVWENADPAVKVPTVYTTLRPYVMIVTPLPNPPTPEVVPNVGPHEPLNVEP